MVLVVLVELGVPIVSVGIVVLVVLVALVVLIGGSFAIPSFH